MVFPRRVADPHAGIREVFFQEISTDFQRARSTQRLDGRHTFLRKYRMIGPKQQRCDGIAVRIEPFHRQIERRSMRDRIQTRFGFGNGL